jgi:NAD(P)-dependent dehydrogenase (short-subunit alcohol dehydrogenase family)
MGRIGTPDFTGEAAFVTGAAGGMGRAIALAFARAGASVVLADVDDAGGEDAASAARALGAAAIFVHCDVSDAAAVNRAVDACIDAYGRLDCAVNAAAIENETTPLHECDDERFDRMQAINVRGLFLSMKAEVLAMLARADDAGLTSGAIVNIASTNSVRPQPNQPAYTASKHAALGLTRAAAIDYAPRGIRINAICPGSIDTPMLRNAMERRGRDPEDVVKRLSLIGRFGTPEEIANAALWLCAEDAGFTMGHALAVDAGYLAR